MTKLLSILPFLFIPLPGMGQISFCGELVPISEDHVKQKLISTIRKNIRQGGLDANIVQERINKYVPYIISVIKKYGLPEDLVFISLAESRLNPTAVSSAGAKGVWQFMPSTATGMGMIVNSEIDERSSIIRSTHAACRYLLTLHKMFGSWALAAAAYNCGPRNIRKSIVRQGQNSYYNLKLNKETSAYLYEIISMKLLYQYSQKKEFPGIYAAQKKLLAQQKDSSDTEIDENDNMEDDVDGDILIPVQKGSAGVAFSSGNSEPIPNIDTIPVTASIVRGEYIQRTGTVIFRTHEAATVAGVVISPNTLIKATLYADRGRIAADIAGVDISPALKQYKILVYDKNGNEGIQLSGRGNKIYVEDGYRTILKVVKDE